MYIYINDNYFSFFLVELTLIENSMKNKINHFMKTLLPSSCGYTNNSLVGFYCIATD